MFKRISMQDDGALVIELEDTPEIQSRAIIETKNALARPAGALAGLAPVGVARGASGPTDSGGQDRPTGRNGRPKWGGDADYSEWWDKNGDKVSEYEATVIKLGIAYFGTVENYSENGPGPRILDWDKLYSIPEQRTSWTANFKAGWYRVGARLKAVNDKHEFGWEYVDVKMATPQPATQSGDATNATAANTTTASNDSSAESQLEIVSRWKVSPTL